MVRRMKPHDGSFDRQVASLHDVEVKLDYATDVLHALDREFDVRREVGAYHYSVEISNGGRRHVYRAVDPPPTGRLWGAQIGTVAHALRSSLEHLTWQLVIANIGSPSRSTHFPIVHRRPRNGSLVISGDVPPGALALIEEAQPYNDSGDGKMLSAIHKLDIFDKHRELMVTIACVHQAIATGPSPLPERTFTFTQRPLEDDSVAVVVDYVEPQREPDPRLTFTEFMTFGPGTPYPGEVVSGFMWQLLAFVENDFVPRFHQWVPPTRHPVNMPSRTRS